MKIIEMLKKNKVGFLLGAGIAFALTWYGQENPFIINIIGFPFKLFEKFIPYDAIQMILGYSVWGLLGAYIQSKFKK